VGARMGIAARLVAIALGACAVRSGASSMTVVQPSSMASSHNASWYIEHTSARTAMLARCDRAHGHRTKFHVPGQTALECEAAIAAQAQLYAVHPHDLMQVSRRCTQRKDPRPTAFAAMASA
jgi:hypothetical protein